VSPAARHTPGLPRSGVLQVVLSLSPGGTERLVIETVRRLRHRYRMAVCCLDDDGVWAEELRQDGIQVEALRRRSGFHPFLGRDIATVAARHGALVLHCHHYSPFVYGCVARAFSPRLRVVFTEHGRFGDGPPSPKRRLANLLFSRIPHRVCVVSGDLRNHLTAEGFKSDDIDVVANGIQAGELPDQNARRQARASLGVDDKAFVIGTIGRLDPVKDLTTLITAFQLFRSTCPAARLVIIGDGPLQGELQRLASATQGILFAGHRSDARSLVAGFDVYVSSSVFEGMSLTILEAMAAGCAVVATRVGGTPEIVVDGETGMLVQPRDAAGLTDALVRLSSNPLRAQAMGLAGRARLCELFTIERMVNYYANAYSALGAF
jgi:glycosyltransferase involved in cell wall biosynthesis